MYVLASHNVCLLTNKTLTFEKTQKRETKGKTGWLEGQVRPFEMDTGGEAVPCSEVRRAPAAG